MGYISSPYTAVRTFYHPEESILGDTNGVAKLFKWNKVVLNLPGGYFNPAINKILKWDEMNQQVAIYMLIYIDDLRVMAPTMELSWGATMRALA